MAGSAAPPILPPRRGSISQFRPSRGGSLTDQLWYWGNISRGEVKELMKHRCDGTFLVRDSSDSSTGDYTLTVRKGGTNKLMRIYQNTKRGYGLVLGEEANTFSTVTALVEFYGTNTLLDLNATMDIKLSYPVDRSPSNTFDGLTLSDFESIHIEYTDLMYEYDTLQDKYSEQHAILQTKHRCLEVYRTTTQVYQEQVKLLQECVRNAPVDDITRLHENYSMLSERFSDLHSAMDRLDHEARRIGAVFWSYRADLEELKPKVAMLKNRRSKASDDLRESDTSDDMRYKINEIIENPFMDKRFWYFDANRDEAMKILNDADNGTFLIRPKRPGLRHCLSIRCDKTVRHCIIDMNEEGHCGFDNNYGFQSLMKLIIHFQKNSLLPYNKHMNTRLLHPALKITEPFYELE